MKYKTIADVIKAKRAGTLPAKFMVWVDNDSVYGTIEGRDEGALNIDGDDDPGAVLISLLGYLGVPARRC